MTAEANWQISPAQRAALEECLEYTGWGKNYYRKRKTMEGLVKLGLAEKRYRQGYGVTYNGFQILWCGK